MIKLKNGSEIHIIKANESMRGSRTNTVMMLKPKIKDIIKDFILIIK